MKYSVLVIDCENLPLPHVHPLLSGFCCLSDAVFIKFRVFF